MTPDPPHFLFVICQHGAEDALKSEVARQWPAFRFAFSRPGFVTFKMGTGQQPEGLDLHATFARTSGISLGKVQGSNANLMSNELWSRLDNCDFDQLHVWQRDSCLPGERGFEPGVTPLAQEIGQVIAERCPADRPLPVNEIAGRGQRVLDCVLVEPTEWWFGCHLVNSRVSRWPGGVPSTTRTDMISRSYLKMQEALHWSKLPISRQETCVEIGSAPGGGTQALLQQGLQVIGIDPAEMDPSLLKNPSFTHVRKRPMDIRRREFRGVKWLVADSNVAPAHTLDSVESIVTDRNVNIRGLILTLKLIDWQLADNISHYVDRVRGWGFSYVKTRQLAFNRLEFCLVALRSRSQRRKISRPSRLSFTDGRLRVQGEKREAEPPQ